MLREQRRLTAVVSVDVVGYSRLMGIDESGTLKALKTHLRELVEPKVVEYGGRTVKTMGDGLLLEFPSVVDAVRSAVDIQRGMAERNAGIDAADAIRFRIGINVGDIIIDGDDIFGDGVNVAARLQALAEPGGICVSRAVRDQVLDKLGFTFEALGAQEVKNIGRPVEVFRVRAARNAGDSIGRVDRPRAWRRLPVLAGAVVLLGLAAWAVVRGLGSVSSAAPPAFSIAIAPMQVRAGDADAAQFADGLRRLLMTEIPRGPGKPSLVLVAAGGDGPHAVVPARESTPGSRYVLEADVAQQGAHFDVALRVRDRASGSQIWASRDQLELADVSAAFSAKLRGLVSQARRAVRVAETRRIAALPIDALSARELVARALDEYEKDQSLEGVRRARALVTEALRIDPQYAAAWTVAAFMVNAEGDVDPNQDRERIGRDQESFTDRAVALDPTDAAAWGTRATALAYLSRWDGALQAAEKAASLEPHESEYRLTQAWLLGLMGRTDDAVAIADDALRIDPGSAGTVARVQCEAQVMAGRFAAAVPACEKSMTLYRDMLTRVYLTAAYAGIGDETKAAAAKAELLRVAPGYTIEQLRAKRYSDHPDYLALAEKNWYAALRKAGIAER